MTRLLFILAMLIPSALLAESLQPPYEEKDWETNENMRNAYLAIDQHKHTGADGSSRLDNLSVDTITVTATISGSVLAAPYPIMIVRDEKAINTAGGTFTLGAWRTRTLNTTSTNTISGASLASNQITLPGGTYYISWSAPAYQINKHQSKIVSVSGSSVSIIGESTVAGTALDIQTVSRGAGIFSVPTSSSTVLELQHQSQTTLATYGFGNPANFTTEVYSCVEIWKLK